MLAKIKLKNQALCWRFEIIIWECVETGIFCFALIHDILTHFTAATNLWEKNNNYQLKKH